MAEKTDEIQLINSSFSEMYETKYFWSIPRFQVNKIYLEKFALSEELECTIMLIPKLEINKYCGNENKFIRSTFKVFFTKVPSEEGRQIRFQFYVGSRRWIQAFSFQSFKKVMLNVEGFLGERNNINSATIRTLLTRTNTMNLNIRFVIDDSKKFKSYSLENFVNERSQTAKDFAVFYKDMKYSDITLVCSNNEKVAAHKALLASRSPVFAKLLTKDASSFEISGKYNKSAMLEFLRFLYCDTISKDKFNDYTIELLELATHFEVAELKKVCQQDLFYGSKEKINVIAQKIMKLQYQMIPTIKDFSEISQCIKKLHKLTKDIA